MSRHRNWRLQLQCALQYRGSTEVDRLGPKSGLRGACERVVSIPGTFVLKLAFAAGAYLKKIGSSTGKKTPGGAGTHTGHTGHTGARGQTDHTDEPHNHPPKPKDTNPHENRDRLNSRKNSRKPGVDRSPQPVHLFWLPSSEHPRWVGRKGSSCEWDSCFGSVLDEPLPCNPAKGREFLLSRNHGPARRRRRQLHACEGRS